MGGWHTNVDLFPALKYENKDIEMSFMGALTDIRKEFFEKHSEFPVQLFSGVSQEEMLDIFAKTKIGINLSINENDSARKTQMKQRMFEVPAGKGLLLTEYHQGIEYFFQPNKEIITFKDDMEFKEKLKFLLNNPTTVEKIAMAGHKRFLKQNTSEKRLAGVVEEIMKK